MLDDPKPPQTQCAFFKKGETQSAEDSSTVRPDSNRPGDNQTRSKMQSTWTEPHTDRKPTPSSQFHLQDVRDWDWGYRTKSDSSLNSLLIEYVVTVFWLCRAKLFDRLSWDVVGFTLVVPRGRSLLTFPQAPPWGWRFCFLVKCLNSCWMDCHAIRVHGAQRMNPMNVCTKCHGSPLASRWDISPKAANVNHTVALQEG